MAAAAARVALSVVLTPSSLTASVVAARGSSSAAPTETNGDTTRTAAPPDVRMLMLTALAGKLPMYVGGHVPFTSRRQGRSAQTSSREVARQAEAYSAYGSAPAAEQIRR